MNKLEKIMAILAFGEMIVIFMFSAQPGAESTSISGSVSYRIVTTVDNVFNIEWSEDEKIEIAQNIDYPVRKCAHMSEYACLTLLTYLAMHTSRCKEKIILPLGITFVYACTDEFHQLFVPGRNGNFIDVMIDTAGGCIMMLFILLVSRIVHLSRR